MIIACNDEVCASGERAGEDNVIIGIATDASRQRSRFHYLVDISESIDRVQNTWSNKLFATQGANELSAKRSRPDNRAEINRLLEQLFTKTTNRERRKEDVRVEQDLHETALNTSSSV